MAKRLPADLGPARVQQADERRPGLVLDLGWRRACARARAFGRLPFGSRSSREGDGGGEPGEGDGQRVRDVLLARSLLMLPPLRLPSSARSGPLVKVDDAQAERRQADRLEVQRARAEAGAGGEAVCEGSEEGGEVGQVIGGERWEEGGRGEERDERGRKGEREGWG